MHTSNIESAINDHFASSDEEGRREDEDEASSITSGLSMGSDIATRTTCWVVDSLAPFP